MFIQRTMFVNCFIAILLGLNVKTTSPLPLSTSKQEIAIRNPPTSLWSQLQSQFADFIEKVFANEHILDNVEQYLKRVFNFSSTRNNEIEYVSNKTIVVEKRLGSRWGGQFNTVMNNLPTYFKAATNKIGDVAQTILQTEETGIMIPSGKDSLTNIINTFRSFIEYDDNREEETKKKKKKKKKKNNKIFKLQN